MNKKVEHIAITIKGDFLATQTRGDPVNALSELIWNSLDADASNVHVEFEKNGLGALSKIVIYDDGEGFSREDALTLFGNLGGSWKRLSRITKTKQRSVHGQEGRGRYKAFALGSSAEWNVCYLKNGKPFSYSILLQEGDLTDVGISEENESPKQKTGVIVKIEKPKKDFQSLSSEAGIQELCEMFALYLMNYKDVSVSISGVSLNPANAIVSSKSYKLAPIKKSDDELLPVTLDIIEWKDNEKRSLYLCTEDGFPFSQVETRFQIPQFSFSAYLKSQYIMELQNEQKLGLYELVPLLRSAVEEARVKIKAHFIDRAADQAKNVVEEWKAEKIYPYKGDAATPLENAERQVFDIVAVNVQSFSPEFDKLSPKTKELQLRMLRQVIENSPSELQLILNEVLQLPKRKQQELAELLQETSLSSIITAAKTVADRLKFLTGLERIIFDVDKKKNLKERSQLHKILEENTWIFGEQYNLWVSDKSLTSVLKKHRDYLDPSIVIDDPVTIEGKSQAIIDLMFSSAVSRHNANDREHLVVELKAPSVKIGTKEITQIKEYAFAVDADERFKSIAGLKWHFWVVSNDLMPYATNEISGGPNKKQRLVYETDRMTVGVKTWAEIIEENRARLQFFQEHLQYNVTDSVALKYLQDRHKAVLEGVIDTIPEVDPISTQTDKDSSVSKDGSKRMQSSTSPDE